MVGYIVALCMGKVDLSALEGIAVVSLPRIMPYKPVFNPSAIVSVTMIFLVSATETIGDTSAMTNTALGREATEKEISGSLACDGFVSSLSACFGCMPITSFSQNVGLLAMTKVINRYTIATGAGILLLAGIFPAFGAILATLPEAVFGRLHHYDVWQYRDFRIADERIIFCPCKPAVKSPSSVLWLRPSAIRARAAAM